MELRHVRLTDRVVAPLIAGLTLEYDRRYGETGEMATVDAGEFDPPSGTFVVLIDGAEVVAGGGLRRVADDTCEVKRMWTAAGHRRKGHASRVLTGLEDAARAAGYSTLLLETGPLQPEAIAMYTRRGYSRIPYYGRYPEALAFRLDLGAPAEPAEASAVGHSGPGMSSVHQVSQPACQSRPSLPIAKSASAPSLSSPHSTASSSSWP
jgi:GNAT superfamily N-acetyltransferase